LGFLSRDLAAFIAIPRPLFLTADGRVKILDFGLARIDAVANAQAETGPYVPAATHPGVVMGTAGYISPEQVRSLPADTRSDIFSFGCVLYEMVTGRRAFRRATGAETMTAILHDKPTDPTTAGQLVPADLVRIIRQCLAKNPNHRLHSAPAEQRTKQILLMQAGSRTPFLYVSPLGVFLLSQRRNKPGGAGLDTFKISPVGSVLSIDGSGAPAGQGDWLDYTAFTTPVIINLGYFFQETGVTFRPVLQD
jgi:serine/threonine protein kinase